MELKVPSNNKLYIRFFCDGSNDDDDSFATQVIVVVVVGIFAERNRVKKWRWHGIVKTSSEDESRGENVGDPLS